MIVILIRFICKFIFICNVLVFDLNLKYKFKGKKLDVLNLF